MTPDDKRKAYMRMTKAELVERLLWREGHRDGYGFCPHCGAKGVQRERRLNGNDTCANGHIYPSRDAEMKDEQCSTPS